jgi:hypothetical protein
MVGTVHLISSKMPLKTDEFVLVQDNLSKASDVDDSRGRSVPVNMNFIEEGYIAKDTGCELFGATETTLTHSPFQYRKKNGTTYIIRVKGTKLQTYNTSTGLYADTASSPTFTAGARMGYIVYENNLYLGNAVESLYKWDGTTFTEYASAPKGNILEIFEDRLFVSGVTAEPLTVYYSAIGDPVDFSNAALVLQPLGTDHITKLENYYGQLLIFKEKSIWKMTFVYDQVLDAFIPKLEVQSNNYGACSRQATTWVENDIWFFTGREVRAIGWRDQQTGVLGINSSVISEQIKETLELLPVTSYSKVVVFYNNRRFYLALPLGGAENDTVFVCHTLHASTWTKYASRIKAQAFDFMEIDGIVYSSKSITPFGTLKWDETLLNDNDVAIPAEVIFRKIEDKDFNRFTIYRYLDFMFKNLEGRLVVTLYGDANDIRTAKSKTFYIGQQLEDMNATLGEVPFGQNLYGDGFGEDVVGSPFDKKRISFLIKAQTLTVALSNNAIGETFTLAQYALTGMKQSRRLFKPSGIISIR